VISVATCKNKCLIKDTCLNSYCLNFGPLYIMVITLVGNILIKCIISPTKTKRVKYISTLLFWGSGNNLKQHIVFKINLFIQSFEFNCLSKLSKCLFSFFRGSDNVSARVHHFDSNHQYGSIECCVTTT
jgi:hypothetical protein